MGNVKAMRTEAKTSHAASTTAVRYAGTAIALHWACAVLIFCGAGLGLFMTGLEFSPAKFRYYAWHKRIGVTVFLLAAARLAWRAGHAPPPLPPSIPRWQVRLSGAAHVSLYVLMLAIPVSGYLYSSATGVSVVYLGLVPLPNLIAKDREVAAVLRLVHFTLNTTLGVLVTVHIVAALKHHLVDRDALLFRMLPQRRTPG